MLRFNRVLWNDNGTLRDLSKALSYPLSGTEVIPYKSATDAIYIGSDLPFNHRWIEASVVNDQVSAVTVAVWDGGDWIPCVDVIDETLTSGTKSLGQSGNISWVPDRKNASWVRQQFTEDMDADEILSTVKIYDLFWAKFTFSADLKATTALKFVGHKFCSDEDLFAEYPDLSNTNILTAFSSGKTTWADQEFLASKYIIEELRNMGIIWSKNQILDWGLFKPACVHKTAEIVYSAFGDDYKDDRANAGIKYKQSLSKKNFETDRNENADLEVEEKSLTRTNWLTR